MKKSITALCLLLLLPLISFNQVPSDCNAPQVLLDEYREDLKHLTLVQMDLMGQNDIEISNALMQPIQDGLAAIFNVEGIPERDSVFSIHCIHHHNSPLLLEGLIVTPSADAPWIEEWENLNTVTGYEELDEFLETYGFEITNWFSWGTAVFKTEQCLNMNGVVEEIVNFDYINSAEPDVLIGGANQILYATDATSNRYYDFVLEWGDCFAGCINSYTWKFVVYPGCSVEYLGAVPAIVSETEPFPSPVNCNLMTAVKTPSLNLSKRVYPNPSQEFILVENLKGVHKATIYTAVGQIVKKVEIEEGKQVDIRELPTGVYLLKLDKGQSMRFVKN